MTTGATGQLGLALPVQGELSGTWGDTVNNGITQYTNIAIAGTLTLTNDGAVTLANTTGDASASNITSSLTGAGTVTAQFAIVRVTGTLTTAKVVTAPSYSKTYTVVNAATGGIVTFKASGQTGVSVAVGETAFVYFNGTDYVKVVGTATAGAAGGSNTQVQFNSSGILAGSANMTFNGTTLTAAGFSGPLNGTVGATTPAAGTFTQVDITAQGTLRLQDTTGGEYVALRAPATLAGNYTLTFPADDGTSGQALITDGSGVLSWSTAASGDVYGPASATANGIALFDGTTGKLLKDSASTNGLIYGLTVGRGAGAVSSNTVVGAGALAGSNSGVEITAIGFEALKTNTTGNYNSAFSVGALTANTSGSSNNAFGGSDSLVGSALGINTTGGTNNAFGNGALATNLSGSSNSAFGHQALNKNTTASNNTAVGYQAAYSNTTGTALQAFGRNALYSNTTGVANVAIGGEYVANSVSALSGNTTGSYNIAVGTGALGSNTTASNNTAVGYQAGYSNTTGTTGVFVGRQAGYSNTTGANTLIGDQAGYFITTGTNNVGVGRYVLNASSGTNTGNNNTAVGDQALALNTTASNNTAVGYQAGYSNTTGAYNVAVGAVALYTNTTGAQNVAIGGVAMNANTTGGDNTAVGLQSLASNTTASNNAAFGTNAMYYNTTGGANTALGKDALLNNTTASQNTAVGYQAGYSNQVSLLFTAIGYQAGYSFTNGGSATDAATLFCGSRAGYNQTSGVYNTYVGEAAGYNMTTGGKNTILGRYSGNQGGLDIRTGSNYVVISDGDGNVPIITGNGLNIALQGAGGPAVGTGIQFPATQNASSDANTLDDYEEGTFTPTIALATPGTSTTANAVGKYTKVGNLVTVVGRIALTKGTGSGNLVLGGLPFASVSLFAYQCSGALSTDEFGVAGKIYQIILPNNSTAPDLIGITQTSGTATTASASDFGSSAMAIRYMFSYQTS